MLWDVAHLLWEMPCYEMWIAWTLYAIILILKSWPLFIGVALWCGGRAAWDIYTFRRDFNKGT